MNPKQQQFTLWYVVVAFLVIIAFRDLARSGHVQNLTYSDFRALLKAGLVEDVELEENVVRGTLRSGELKGLVPEKIVDEMAKAGDTRHTFTAVRIPDAELIKDLEATGVRYQGRLENKWLPNLLIFMVPILLLYLLWGGLMKRMGGMQSGMMEIGKSRAKVYIEKATGTSFNDVAGIDEARDELREIVNFLKFPADFQRLGGKIPKGALLVGPPGCGKTLLAKAVAGEAGVPFFSMSGAGFVEMFVGVGAARVRDLFVQAQKQAPCIIFIDELDALGKARGTNAIGGHDEREQTLNQLLVEMDGFDTSKGIIILAATNRPEILDLALLRPGRFDRQVAIDRPDFKGREMILKVHARNVVLSDNVSLARVAATTPGFVGADLANIVNEAALRAARLKKASVEMQDFEDAIDRIVGGLERRTRLINDEEREAVAYHEAGHAIIAHLRPGADPVSKVSIIPRGVAALGYTQQTPAEDRYLLRKSELLDRLDVLFGGRAAEDLIYGDVSTGAHNDLQRATVMARQVVMRYGMNESVGLASLEPSPHSFLNVATTGPREYSERTAQLVDDEVRKMLAEAYERTRASLRQHRAELEEIAQLLLEKEVIHGNQLEAVMGDKPPRSIARLERPEHLI